MAPARLTRVFQLGMVEIGIGLPAVAIEMMIDNPSRGLVRVHNPNPSFALARPVAPDADMVRESDPSVNFAHAAWQAAHCSQCD